MTEVHFENEYTTYCFAMAYVNIAYARSVQDRISSLDQNTVLVDYRGGWEENKERKQSSTPGFVGLFFDYFFFFVSDCGHFSLNTAFHSTHCRLPTP